MLLMGEDELVLESPICLAAVAKGGCNQNPPIEPGLRGLDGRSTWSCSEGGLSAVHWCFFLPRDL